MRRPAAGGGSSTRAGPHPSDIALDVRRGGGGRDADRSRRGALRHAAGEPSPACGDQAEERAMSANGAERARMADAGHPENGWHEASPWYEWGPYLSERAWGSVREDYSASGDAWNGVPARPRAIAGVPLERGRHGGHDRRLQPAVARALAVERGRSHHQGADVRAGQPGGQSRRGRQGILVVPRRGPEQRLAALALSLPAGRLPVRAPHRGEPHSAPSSSRNSSCSTPASSTTTATGSSRSTTRRRRRRTS